MENLIVTQPLGYFEFLSLLLKSSWLCTDSGGAQTEAYFYNVPCVTLRNETEWLETIRDGWNVLVGMDCSKLVSVLTDGIEKKTKEENYGNGRATELILEKIRDI